MVKYTSFSYRSPLDTLFLLPCCFISIYDIIRFRLGISRGAVNGWDRYSWALLATTSYSDDHQS